MIENLELGETLAHPSMPASYVEFVRQLWRTQTNESQNTFGRELVAARRRVFLRLLASERLGKELGRIYEMPVGSKIAEALTSQAVHIPELWKSEDKRPKKEQVTQFKKLRTAIKEVSSLLDEDRRVPDEEDTTEVSSGEYRQGKRSSKVDARAHRLVPLAFENVLSAPLLVRSWNGWIPSRKPDLKGMRLRLSLYQLHEILRAFDKPLGQAIENINKFRTHAVDDQIVMHMGQVPKGIAWIRHAALLLDQSIDRFSCDFTQFKRKLSRDKLVSVFVMAIYPNIREETADYKAINRICGSRRKSIRNSVISRTDGSA